VATDDNDFLGKAWDLISSTWQEQGLITMFSSLHPILENFKLCESFKTGTASVDEGCFRLGESVSIDLKVSPENRLAAYKKQFRQDIKRSLKRGLKVEQDEQWSGFDTFVRLYRASMANFNADERYWYSAGDLQKLIDALGDKCCLTVIRIEGEIAAALMMVIHDDIAQAHLTGIDERFKAHSPLKLLLHESANIASDLGANVLHLGAGLGGKEDSLFKFKAQYSKCRHNFVVGRWVIDETQYQLLNEKNVPELDSSTPSAFFPRYRA
jgi:lipid II:glycine glycyltransferase (peptidoglycan interpeptide bridge formation enzyme)